MSGGAPIVLDGQDELAELFAALQDAANNLDYDDAFEEVRELAEETHAEYHAQQKSPDGDIWADNHPEWQGIKGHNIRLFYKGRLLESVSQPGGTADTVFNVTNDEMEWGTSVPYAAFQHYGGTTFFLGRTWRVPARQHVGMSEEMIDQAVDILADSVMDQLLEAFNV